MGSLVTATLKPGDPAPDWTLADGRRQEHRLADALGPRGAVLMFVRGMFCPYCTEQLHQLWEGAGLFAQRQVSLLVITPYGPGAMAIAAALAGSRIPVLIDSQRQVIGAYGLLHDVPDFADVGYPSGDLVHPTAMVLDAGRRIRWLYVGDKYNDRPTLHDILEQVDQLPAA